jgi:hypothetical protein
MPAWAMVMIAVTAASTIGTTGVEKSKQWLARR